MTDEGYRTFLLQHDNASSHTAIPTLAFIGSSDILMVPHPPYSPDLAPCDYFLCPRLKVELHGCKFRGLPELQTAVRQALKNIPKEDYQAALECLPVRWMKCVKNGGQYFEGQHIQINPEDDHGLSFGTQESDSDQEDSQEEEE